MKYKMLRIAIGFMIVFSLAACPMNPTSQSQQGYNLNQDVEVLATTNNQHVAQLEVLLDEEFYKLVKKPDYTYYYYIYDDRGDIVDEGELCREPNLSLLEGDVVNLHVGVGTGIAWDQYYSVKRDSFSRIYYYVVAYNDETIAYIYVPDENPFVGRRLVVRNVFDKSKYYKEFQLDFSESHTPIMDAKFIGSDHLEVTYQTGSDYNEVTEILDLNHIE